MTSLTLGFIGLGIMGRPMVQNLLTAGFAVHVYSTHGDDIEKMVAAGAIGQSCPKDVAAQADITITMVPNTSNVEAALFGADGVIESLGPSKIVVDMSTISSIATREFAKRIASTGAHMLDAPVSGGDTGAAAGTLSIMVGGETDVVARVRPVFDVLGSRLTHVGGNGAGQVVKSCNQTLAAATVAALCEALVIGAKSGVEAGKIVEVLSAGYARCGALDIRGAALVERDFNPGFKSKLQYKDLGLAVELARGVEAPTPVLAVVHELYKSAQAIASGDEDHTNVLRVLESLAGLDTTTGALA